MVHLSLIAFALALSSVTASPPGVNIAQNIAESMTIWEKACDKAGGGLSCNDIAVASFTTLLANAGPCAQQDAADKQVTFAKSLRNNRAMIKASQIFVQQPRNSPSSESVPYCQSSPKNTELNGLFQCQFEGVNPTTFVGGVPVGKKGTIPFRHNKPQTPPGSCPAHPSGPIPDGKQLFNFV